MLKYIITLICLISFIHSYYLPYKKNKNYPEDTCSYVGENNIIYVKDCDEGKYCNDRGNSFSICENIPTDVKLILENGEENCESDFQCETGLECINRKCTKDCSNYGTGYTSIRTQNGYTCSERDNIGVFYKKDFTWHADNTLPRKGYITDNARFLETETEHFKVIGKITMHETTDTDGKIYEPEKIEHTDIGTLEDGEFVYDEKACSSGFALYFYGDGTLTKPYKHNNYNYMYKKCVTLEDIEQSDSGYCKIKYKVGDNGNVFNYNVNMLNGKKTCYEDELVTDNSYYDSLHYDQKCSALIRSSELSSICSSNLKIKLQMFKNYISALNNDNKKCTEPEKYNRYELETCKDNALRKWSYFYENPDDYVLYYDEDKASTVVNYLIQTIFPSYQFTEFLNIKYFISLLLLLYL
jgi:hypothetical protein